MYIHFISTSIGAWKPFIGNGSAMFKPYGMKMPEKNIAELKAKIDTAGVNMIRTRFPAFNPGIASEHTWVTQTDTPCILSSLSSVWFHA